MALKVTQTRSAIGSKPKQRGTLRALGLGRIGRSNVLPDRPEIHGMIHRVPHLVTVEQVSESASGAKDQTKAEKAPAEAAKKAPTKKTATKKAVAKKTATKKSTTKKAAAKKAPAKKSASGSAASGGDDDKAST